MTNWKKACGNVVFGCFDSDFWKFIFNAMIWLLIVLSLFLVGVALPFAYWNAINYDDDWKSKWNDPMITIVYYFVPYFVIHCIHGLYWIPVAIDDWIHALKDSEFTGKWNKKKTLEDGNVTYSSHPLIWIVGWVVVGTLVILPTSFLANSNLWKGNAGTTTIAPLQMGGSIAIVLGGYSIIFFGILGIMYLYTKVKTETERLGTLEQA